VGAHKHYNITKLYNVIHVLVLCILYTVHVFMRLAMSCDKIAHLVY